MTCRKTIIDEIDNHDYTKDRADDDEQDDFHSQKVECNQQ